MRAKGTQRDFSLYLLIHTHYIIGVILLALLTGYLNNSHTSQRRSTNGFLSEMEGQD
jgi:hypothetical protein